MKDKIAQLAFVALLLAVTSVIYIAWFVFDNPVIMNVNVKGQCIDVSDGWDCYLHPKDYTRVMINK